MDPPVNIHRPIQCFVIFCISVFLAACGGSGSSSSSPPSKSAETLASVLAQPLGKTETICPDLLFTPSTAVPGTEITLTGLPNEFGDSGLRVIASNDNSAVAPAFFFANDTDNTNTYRFVAPLHPDGNLEGGEVLLEVGDGEQYCPAVEFTVLPLPDADADYAEQIQQKMAQWVDESLRLMGEDPEQLLDADLENLNPFEQVLWLAKQLVSGDGTDDLPALFAAATDDETKALQRILLASGIEGELDQALDKLDNATPWELVPATSRAASRSIESYSQTTTRRSATSRCEARKFDPKQLRILSAEELSQRMLAAKGGPKQYRVSSAVLGITSLFNNGRAGTVAGHTGNALFVTSMMQGVRFALEPQNITQFSLGNVEKKWQEDRPQDQYLRWLKAEVHASGDSFNLTKATLESLIQITGMVPGPVGTTVSAVSLIDELSGHDRIGEALDKISEDSCVRIRAPEYGPISVVNDKWTESEINGTTVEMHPSEHNKYRGIDIGTSKLIVTLKSEEFGDEPPLRVWQQKRNINVEKIGIAVAPSSPIRVDDPGETLDIYAKGTNTYHGPDKDSFSVSVIGAGSIGYENLGPDDYYAAFVTPENAEDYPTSVKFAWTGKTLPLPTEPDRRTRTVWITSEKSLRILSKPDCLAPGATLELDGELKGFPMNEQDISWRVSGGSVTNQGGLSATYTAPTATGSYRITATAEADSDIQDTLDVSVSDHCFKKLWAYDATIRLPGSGDDFSSCSPGASEPKEQEEKLTIGNVDQSDLLPPNTPPANLLWFNREEQLAPGTLTQFSQHKNDECDEVSLSSHNDSSVTYSSNNDGQLAFSIKANLKSECKDYPNDAIECSGGDTHAVVNGFYYVPISAEATLHLTGELECNRADDEHLMMQFPLTVIAARFDAQGNAVVDPAAPLEHLPRDPSGNPIIGPLFEGGCVDENELHVIDRTFTVNGAPEGEQHLLLISISSPGGIRVTGLPWKTLEQPKVYEANPDINFSITLTPQ